MSKTKSAMMVAAAIVSMFVFGTNAQAQDCGCASPAPVVFGYPASSGCSGGCLGSRGGKIAGCKAEFKAKLAHAQQVSDVVAARNAAWPKPFACADKQLYHSLWTPMINAGFEDQCILSNQHFDPQSGELTKYGKQQIAGVMNNMPQHRKVVYVQRLVDEATTMARYQKVSEVVQTWYGKSGSVQLSNRTPKLASGPRSESITNLYRESAPIPIIPIASGSDSVSSSIGN